MKLCAALFFLFSSSIAVGQVAEVYELLPASETGTMHSSLPDAPSSVTGMGPVAVSDESDARELPDDLRPMAVAAFIRTPEESEPREFEWRSAANQSFVLLSFQHAMRLLQGKTRRQLGGPFFSDWGRSLQGVDGWSDGDGAFTNYVLHPGMGGIAHFIYLQNSGEHEMEPNLSSREYWTSRLKGTAFAAIYSTQFEIGPYSEATVGNVGLRPGTSGYSDFVMTPLGGLAFAIIEDWADTRIEQHELRGLSPMKTRLLRSLLNPERAIANMLRRKVPWHRDTR